MADLPARSDLFGVGRRSIITTPGLRINPRVVDTPGSDVNIIIGAESLMGEEVVAALAGCFQGLFVETAQGDHLDRVAFDRYGLTRFPATPSVGQVRLFRVSAAAGAFTYPAGSRVQTAAGEQYAIDVDAVFGASDLQKTVNATALVAGPGGNVAPNQIVQFADQPFDGTLQVQNSAGFAGGIDAETDSQFRGRIRGFFPTLRRGTLGAIEFGALQVPGIAVARAVEIVNTTTGGDPIPACAVELIVADRDGGSSIPLLQAVRDKLIEFRAAGIPVTVTGGAVVPVAVRWDIDFDSGVDTVQVSQQVRAVTVAVSQFLRPGETLYRSSLIAGARQIPGAIVRDTSLVAPVGDIVPTTNTQILRVLSTGVTFI